jgi:Ca-activated chloride channel family protein
MEKFRFEHIEYLNLLYFLPLLIVLFIVMQWFRKRNLKKLGQREIISRILEEVSAIRPVVKFVLLTLSLAAVIVALAGPQMGSKLKTVKRKGIELIIALDVSNSMLAEDIQPSRLERAKMEISRLAEKFENDRFGLIVFAGKAYTQIPVTSDFDAVKLFLSSVDTRIVPSQGTAIGSAISLAINSFDPSSELEKAVIVITDGENHEDNPVDAAKEAREKGVRIYTVGMGTLKGAPIPIVDNYGRKRYMKDKNGDRIVTKMNNRALSQIAAAGGGKYYQASSSDIGLNKLFKEISKLDEKEIESKVYEDYNDIFQYFVATALILLLLDYIILERKNRWLSKINMFGQK